MNKLNWFGKLSWIGILLVACFSGRVANGKNYTNADSVRVTKLIKDAMDTIQVDPEKSLLLAQQAIKTGELTGFKYGLAKALSLKAYLSAAYGNTDSAIYLYKESLTICKANNFPKIESSVYSNLGRTYYDMGDDQNATECYQQALVILKTAMDSTVLAAIYFNLGNTMLNVKNFEYAEKYFLQSLDIYTAIHANPYYISTLYNSIGMSCFSQKKYPRALNYLHLSLQIADSLHYKESLMHAYSTLSSVFTEMHNFDSALKYDFRSLSLSKELKDLAEQAGVLCNIGQVYYRKNDLKNAEKCYLEGYKLAVTQADINNLPDYLGNLADLYEKEKDFKKAYEFRTKQLALNDSLFNKAKLKALGALTTRFERRELENKNESLQKEAVLQKLILQRKNGIIYGTVSALVLLLAISSLIFRQNKLKANHQRVELEQKQLRAQMNPHFIFNCLNSIQHFVVANDVKNANKYLSGFALLMRQTLENSKDGTITLRKELAYLENYLALELMRFEDKFNYEIKCAANVNNDTTEIPAMIIQPFIENAIRHGLCYLNDRKGRLTLNFYLKDGYLFCEIDDNGIGREESFRLKMASDLVYESQGMELTRQRLALVSKSNGSDYEIAITDKKNENGESVGTTITIKFPTNV